jgi:exosortase/archaeosortase family protein
MANSSARQKTVSINSAVRNNASLIAKIGVLLAAVLVVYGADLSVVFSKALTFNAGNITNYVLVIPFLILFVLHRKRSVLLAVASQDGKSRRSLRLDDVLGAALCAVAVIVYVIGTTTLYSMEFHLISLPVFVAGATMLLFNIATFRHSFICVVFLAYLQPPPADLLAEIAADMSWSSAVIVQYMLSAIGLPISLDASFGAPALVMQDSTGAKIPFYVGEPSSGTYSIVGLSVFSIFVAYVLRGKLWKRALILLVGFPVFYILNALRIALIIFIWYTSGESAAESFHVVSGTVMSAVGTLVLLFFADLVLRLGMRAPPRKVAKCPACERSLAAGEPLCLLCGRHLKRYTPPINSQLLARMVLLGLISSLVVSAQIAAIQNTSEMNASEMTLYNLNIDDIEGPETASIFMPQIDGWSMRYAFRDTKVESILNQDATLAYRYTSNSTTATGGKPAVNAGLQISRTLHTWEGSLLVYPSKFGRPSATVVDIAWVPLADDKNARFFAYKKPGQEYTEAVLYWTDRRELRFDSGIESRNVQVILHVNMDYLAQIQAIGSTTDTEGTKQLLLSLAGPIMKHWDDISISSTSARTVDAILTRRPYLPLGITVGVAAIFAIAILARTDSVFRSNRKLYEQIRVGEEKLILDSIADNSRSSRHGLTGEAIVDRHPALASNVNTSPRFIDLFRRIRSAGLIEDKIHSQYDEPVLVWMPNFHTGSGRGRRQLGGLIHS